MHGLSPESVFAGVVGLVFAVAGFDLGIAWLVTAVRGSADSEDRSYS